jgi:hypothetical protein
MARKPRVEFEGTLYHIIVRGNHRRDVFRERRDRVAYLAFVGCDDHKVGFLAAVALHEKLCNQAKHVLCCVRSCRGESMDFVGCDCTREMRLAVDRNQTTALATIDTHIRGQAQKIVQAACAKMIESWNRNCIR